MTVVGLPSKKAKCSRKPVSFTQMHTSQKERGIVLFMLNYNNLSLFSYFFMVG